MSKRTVYEFMVAYRGGSASSFAYNTREGAERAQRTRFVQWRMQKPGGRITNVSKVTAKVIGR